jgi:ATP-dependent helicase Lhr and Lhr-like helicase
MMNLPVSSSESSAFHLLDRRIQRWIWAEGWSTLRDIQEQAIPAIIAGDRDIIISAATASGKTEAAFFPILSALVTTGNENAAVLYISPLKALINDQWERLTDLCRSLDLPVIPWHGDISGSRKHKFLGDPRGILLITPESLEALFVTRGSSMAAIARSFRYVVVDELHAFIGSERGKQLQSLLHRVELTADKRLPRIALSATLGDMRLAAEFLRPGEGESVRVLDSKADHQELRIMVKGYRDGRSRTGAEQFGPKESALHIADNLYSTLHGSNNLIFPNSRSLVENYADVLRRMCERNGIPNEFWPHHGNLSKELREQTERALKEAQWPATAVCTSTLELGIDIGSVRSIAQIGPPPSVSSLRQRLGRSGRRPGEPAILRCYCTEADIQKDSPPSDRLREGLVQTVATVRLLVQGWFEPPQTSGLHASTFVQQVLSLIAERGGASAASVWSMLVDGGPFEQIDMDAFITILKELGAKDLICQDNTGLLLHGGVGERLVNHYDFYAAFTSEEEFSVQCEGHTLGSLPVSRPLVPEQRIIFAGRRWRVIDADLKAKRIVVVPDAGGAPPSFDSAGALVHDRVRQEMRTILTAEDSISFTDQSASTLLAEARGFCKEAELDRKAILEWGDSVFVFTWRGDRVNDAMALLFSARGFRAWNEGLAVHISKCTPAEAQRVVGEIANGIVDPAQCVITRNAITKEKWDWALPFDVLLRSYVSRFIDFEGAVLTARKLSR